jgi:hypothetical protein
MFSSEGVRTKGMKEKQRQSTDERNRTETATRTLVEEKEMEPKPKNSVIIIFPIDLLKAGLSHLKGMATYHIPHPPTGYDTPPCPFSRSEAQSLVD